MIFRRHKEDPRPIQIIEHIPNEIWEMLTIYERGVMFAVEDCLHGRFTTEEMRERLDEAEELRRLRETS